MVHFISEVSSNHSKDLERSISFIDKSAEIGCSSVKFQLFKIDELFSSEAIKLKPEIALRKEWELPLEFIPELKKRCIEKNIEFGCTPFYLDAVDELVDHVDYFKIASYEILWHDLIEKCAETNKKLILSTGMATLDEIKRAVDICSRYSCKPILLHCNSSYPTPIEDVNLKSIKSINDSTGCDTGWSDHSVNKNVIMRAIYKWNASHIEFHLDLDGEGAEFTTGHCWLPNEIKKLIKLVNQSEILDGSGIKGPSNSEIEEVSWRADPTDGLRPLISTREQIIRDLEK